MRYIYAFLLVIYSATSFAQNGIIKGRVFDPINNEAIIGAEVVIQGTTTGTISDIDGNFAIIGLNAGTYNIEISYLGFEKKVIADLAVSNVTPVILSIELQQSSEKLEEVIITANPFSKPIESTTSLNTLSENEIKRSPGGNRDISRVVRLLPGVGSGVSFRNDLIVRGGSPSENKFFIDDIEIPSINHFVTQGASGGSNGLINTDFISNVDFYAAAFPASRYGTLSSVMEFSLKDGRSDRVGSTFTLGASEAALTLEGPLSKNKNHTFLVSARRSYLQLLFKAIGLPFLPTYNDFQIKTTHKINDKNDLTFVALGAIDNLVLNDKLEDGDETAQYLYNNLPYFDQWSYTTGLRYRHFMKNGYMIAVASRNMLNNGIYKYKGNDNSNDANKLFDLNAAEAENKLRWEHVLRVKGYKLSYGVNYEYDRYTNQTYRKIALDDTLSLPFNFSSLLKMQRYGFFVQASKKYFNEKFSVSIGLRGDGSSYNTSTRNPFRQLSPRISLAYDIMPQLSINASAGLYFQMPTYTLLGNRDASGILTNINTLKFIQNTQYVAGVTFLSSFNTKFSLEGFYKQYNNYPMLTTKGISFANEGGFFGVVGDEPAISTSKGKSYGVEFLMYQKIYKGFYGIISYTFFRSLFTDINGDYRSASWDNRHILNLSGGYKFKKNWELGLRYRVNGGAPFTPYDIANSALKVNWDIRNEGILDYSQLNGSRLKPYQQLDIRIDKKWYFKRWNINPYLDLQNITFSTEDQNPYIDTVKDSDGEAITNPDDRTRYQLKTLKNSAGSLIPTIGLVVEF
jgi:hypothetical protein